MKLSVVTTLYKSAPHLNEFYRRIKRQAEEVSSDHEIILVNDGSPDDSLNCALLLGQGDRRVCVVDLSRNFGHHQAIMAGLAYAQGQEVFLIDCDLEEEPELLGQLRGRFVKGDVDVVYGVQQRRKGDFFERISGDMFYALLNVLVDSEFPRNVLTARVMSRRYVQALLQHKEKAIFLAGLLHITGYTQVPMPVVKHSRPGSTYSLRKRVALFVNSITSFTDKPLILIFYMGALISLLATLWSCRIVYRKIFLGVSVGGWTSLIVSIWMLGGLTIFSLGVIGIYLSKVFLETKDRPRAIVRAVYKDADDSL